MLGNVVANIPVWLLVRVFELTVLFGMHAIYFGVNGEPLSTILHESAYYTALYAFVGYVYLGYAVFQLILVAVVSVGWKRKLTCSIAYMSPVYVPVSMVLSGSLPGADPIYLLRSPFFLVALLLAVLANRWGYSKICSRRCPCRSGSNCSLPG